MIYTKKKFNKEERFLIDTPKFQNQMTKTEFCRRNQMTKTEFCRRNQISTEKKFKFFLTVNQVLTKKLEKKLEKNLVSSENGSIFASRNKGERNPKQKKV